MAENFAGEIGAELALDEAGDDAALFPGGGEEGLEVLLHGAVENGLLRLAPLVRECIGEAVGDGLTRHGQSPMRVACLLRNVPCGREKATKRPGVLVRSRPRRGEEEIFF